MTFFTALISLTLFSSSAYAGVEACENSSCDRMIETVRRLIDTKFPRLAERKVRITEFTSDDTFLQAQPKHVLRSGKNRVYEIQVNPRLFDDPPSASALEAILVHELSHLNDYTYMNSFEIADLGLMYVQSGAPRGVVRYERATDETAMRKGFASGIREYRQWLYGKVSGRALELKKKIYYTPEEIDAYVKNPPHMIEERGCPTGFDRNNYHQRETLIP
jgi:hypothetical protein